MTITGFCCVTSLTPTEFIYTLGQRRIKGVTFYLFCPPCLFFLEFLPSRMLVVTWASWDTIVSRKPVESTDSSVAVCAGAEKTVQKIV